MTLLAPTLQAFFTTRMTSQFGASPHTVAAYRDTWRLLLTYLADATGTPPENLDLAALTPDQVSGFLNRVARRGTAIGRCRPGRGRRVRGGSRRPGGRGRRGARAA